MLFRLTALVALGFCAACAPDESVTDNQLMMTQPSYDLAGEWHAEPGQVGQFHGGPATILDGRMNLGEAGDFTFTLDIRLEDQHLYADVSYAITGRWDLEDGAIKFSEIVADSHLADFNGSPEDRAKAEDFLLRDRDRVNARNRPEKLEVERLSDDEIELTSGGQELRFIRTSAE